MESISERVTPHSLRRTYAAMRFALGDDPVYVAAQMGHEDGLFSMRDYAKALRRPSKPSGAALTEFDQALPLGRDGQGARFQRYSGRRSGRGRGAGNGFTEPRSQHQPR